jgi:hypothetical protein
MLMKKVCAYIALIAMLAVTACKKDHKDDDAGSNSLIGYWELVETSSSWMPATTYPPESGNWISFTGTTYSIARSGQPVQSGTYTVQSDATVNESVCLQMPGGTFTNRIIYDSNYNATKVFFYIDNGMLTIVSGCYALDAGTKAVYRKAHSLGAL